MLSDQGLDTYNTRHFEMFVCFDKKLTASSSR